MKPKIILRLEEELKIKMSLSSFSDFFDFKNKNTYKVDTNGEVISLNLFENGITDISFIKEFQKLKELDLRNNPIRNFTHLQYLKHIILLGYHSHKINSESFIDNFLRNEIFDMNRHTSKIAAVYIHSHDFLFEKPQLINLGGKNIYKIEGYTEKSVEISSKENPNFIENFFGDDISLVTAIVGENGTGKTSLITKLFNQLIPVRIGNEKTIFFIIEEVEKIIYYSFFNLEKDFKINSKNIDAEIFKEPMYGLPIYFSNYLSDNKIEKDKSNSLDLSLMNQILNDINLEELSIYNSDFSFIFYKNTQLKRWMKMLSNKDVKNILDEYSLPIFKNISIEFYGNKVITANTIKNFPFNNADFKHRKNLTKDVEKTLSILSSINVFLREKTSKYSVSQPNNIQAIDFLNLRLMQFITDLIYSPTKKNIFPKIENLDDFKNLNDLPSSIEIFKILQNNFSFLDVNYKKSNVTFPFDLFFDFSKKIENLISNNDSVFEGFYKVIVNFESATIILNLYEKLYIELGKSFNLNNHQFIKFYPNIILSSGEEMILNLISLLYDNREKNTNVNLPKILFLDEADLGLHPKWKKKFINTLIKVLPKIFTGMRLQIIFTTHDPLTLSDIPNSNIVYLKKENGETIVLDDEKKPQKSFGANITDLLGDSFFIDNGLIGDFAKDKINSVIDWLMDDDRDKKNSEYYRRIIEIIDEPLVKYKLKEMYYEKFPKDFDREKEIEKLSKIADELGYKIQKK